ncbi:hypothetical protein QR680_008844 [Steinernema hermaphroditum]|uniref:Uncharacterized protein n=1 Tax=Steinernema hermaphroditum TaxID=289476 RepID=A0AA39M7S6_9BILA|nr:hypothetical protein QR680_008844 [Steinernema hermaphroditum]
MADTYDDDEDRLVIDDRLENSGAGAEMETEQPGTAGESTVVEKEKKVLTNGNAVSPPKANHVDDGDIAEQRTPEKNKCPPEFTTSPSAKRKNDENSENGTEPLKPRKRKRNLSPCEEASTTSESSAASPNENCRDCAMRRKKQTRDQETCVNTRSCQSDESLIDLKEGMSIALNFTIVCRTGPNTYYIMTKLKGKSLYGVLTDGEPPLMVPTHNGSKRANLCDPNGDYSLSNGGSAADIRSTASTPSKQRPGSKRTAVSHAVKLNFGRGNRERSAGVSDRPTSSCVAGEDEDSASVNTTRMNSPVTWETPSASATELVEREDQSLKRCLYPSCQHRYESCDALHLHTASAHGPRKKPLFESIACQTSLRSGNGSMNTVGTATDEEPQPETKEASMETDPEPEKPCEKCVHRAAEDAKREEKVKLENDLKAEASTSATPQRPAALSQKTSPTVSSSPFGTILSQNPQVIKTAEPPVTPKPSNPVAPSASTVPKPQPSPALSTTPKLPTVPPTVPGFPGAHFFNPFMANVPGARLTPKDIQPSSSSSRPDAVTPKPHHKIHELGRLKKDDEKTASPSTSAAKPAAAFPSSSAQNQSSFMKPSTSSGVHMQASFPNFGAGAPGMMLPPTSASAAAVAYQQQQHQQQLMQQYAMAMMQMQMAPHMMPGMGSPMRPMIPMMMPDQQQLHSNAGAPGAHPAAAMFAQQFKPS